ncbi:hypothetical protein [Qipengyuania sp. SM2507]
MAWYKAGTVTVTNGSATVTGAGTAFVANAKIGEGFEGPDGRTYEIADVPSNTVLTLARTYTGATAAGQNYGILPTQSLMGDVVVRLDSLLASFSDVRDGIGAGLFPDGSLAAPAMRFAVDQDTGLRLAGSNSLAVVAGGADRLSVSDSRLQASVRFSFVQQDNVGVTSPALGALPGAPAGTGVTAAFSIANSYGLLIGTYGFSGDTWLQSQRIDGVATAYNLNLQPAGGNLLVGTVTSSDSSHRMVKPSSESKILGLGEPAADVHHFYGAFGAAGSAAAAAYRVNANGTTGRSINAGGTINASGADYAEYVRKADGCGDIAKGDVCGIDREGLLTKSWPDAVRYVVKSTDPNLVGGDSWGHCVGARPATPSPLGAEPSAPVAPAPFTDAAPEQAEDESEGNFAVRQYLWQEAKDAADAEMAQYTQALAAFPSALAQWQAAKTQHEAAMATHAADLAAWEEAFEAERQTVDRIAFCGQAPVNVDSETLAACENALDDGEAVYLVAVANGGGIGAQAVPEADMTLPLYMRRLGAVWRIEDGRPVIDVQHG